jgi:hypothetical protein
MMLNVPPVLAEYLEAERAKDARRLTGDFPGSPVEMSQVFALHDGKIVSLEIHS